jgi:lactoylglutathione lyase
VFSHIVIGVGDFERALAFYTPLAAVLGIELRFCDKSRPWAAGNRHPGRGRC